MNKAILFAACAVFFLPACAAVPTGKAAVGMVAVLGAGTALNVHNSDDPIVDSAGEAKDRVIADIKEGYSREEFVGFELNK